MKVLDEENEFYRGNQGKPLSGTRPLQKARLILQTFLKRGQ
jgi:hypothetical protein